MTTETTSTTEAGRALKARHRAMWAFGDYPAVATDLVSELGPVLVGACGIRPGDRVLDVAAGTGNAAIPAAEAGASVVASDLTPELLEAGPWMARPPERRASGQLTSPRQTSVRRRRLPVTVTATGWPGSSSHTSVSAEPITSHQSRVADGTSGKLN